MQSQHDEQEAKFFEEKAALEAKYQKLYEPLYSKVILSLSPFGSLTLFFFFFMVFNNVHGILDCNVQRPTYMHQQGVRVMFLLFI